jgi:hypothetical protein
MLAAVVEQLRQLAADPRLVGHLVDAVVEFQETLQVVALPHLWLVTLVTPSPVSLVIRLAKPLDSDLDSVALPMLDLAALPVVSDPPLDLPQVPVEVATPEAWMRVQAPQLVLVDEAAESAQVLVQLTELP